MEAGVHSLGSQLSLMLDLSCRLAEALGDGSPIAELVRSQRGYLEELLQLLEREVAERDEKFSFALANSQARSEQLSCEVEKLEQRLAHLPMRVVERAVERPCVDIVGESWDSLGPRHHRGYVNRELRDSKSLKTSKSACVLKHSVSSSSQVAELQELKQKLHRQMGELENLKHMREDCLRTGLYRVGRKAGPWRTLPSLYHAPD